MQNYCPIFAQTHQTSMVQSIEHKFMEAEGASEQPDAIKYLSAYCDVSQLVLSTHLEARKVTVPVL